ncbi:MAG: TetR/AcrR family transcriptional regulator [Syntrophomonadaceae bacterium]
MSFKQKQREFKKKVICEVAYDLLTSKPVESVSVDDIARLVGCAKGTIYLYFKNKDDILHHLVSEGLQKLCSDMEDQCLKVRDIREAINNYIKLQFHFFKEYNFLLSSWLRRRMEEKIRPECVEEINNMLDRKIQIVAEMLGRGIKDGFIIKVDAYQLANLMESVFREATFPFISDEAKEKSEHKLNLLNYVVNNGILIRNTT